MEKRSATAAVVSIKQLIVPVDQAEKVKNFLSDHLRRRTRSYGGAEAGPAIGGHHSWERVGHAYWAPNPLVRLLAAGSGLSCMRYSEGAPMTSRRVYHTFLYSLLLLLPVCVSAATTERTVGT